MHTSCSSTAHHFQLLTSKASALHVTTSESHCQTSSSTSSSAQTPFRQLWSPQHNIVSIRILLLSPYVSWSPGCGSNKHSQRVFQQQKVSREDELQASSEAKYFCLSCHFKRCQPFILKASKTVYSCLSADFKLDQKLFLTYLHYDLNVVEYIKQTQSASFLWQEFFVLERKHHIFQYILKLKSTMENKKIKYQSMGIAVLCFP